MQEKELEIPGGSLYYEVRAEGIFITRFHGTASEVRVPERIEDTFVTGIGKKAFLSRKNLRRVVLPETTREIGDWAFAYCDALEQVTLPERRIHFGKTVFMGCGSLVRIASPTGSVPAELLAAAVRDFESYYLLDMTEAGSGEWLKKWDAKLTAILHAPDQEGYSKQVLCGEEDYGSTDLEAYKSGSRRRKVRLALLRCLFSQGLSQELKEELQGYLLSHTKGGESEETWQVVLEEHGEHREYYELFTQLGCVHEDNLNQILTDIGGESPEMKAYFLRSQEGYTQKADFFDSLDLNI